jgi:hypothetical protein
MHRAAGTRSQASTTPRSQARSPDAKSPPKPSRNSTTTGLPRDKGRAKDRETEGEDANTVNTTTTAIAATVNGSSSHVDLARRAASTPAHTPGPHNAIDPLSHVSCSLPPAQSVSGAMILADAACPANLPAKEHRTVDPTTTDPDGRGTHSGEFRSLEKCGASGRGSQGQEVGPGCLFEETSWIQVADGWCPTAAKRGARS